jgi:hypothetical protein
MVSLAIGQLYCDRTILSSQISIVMDAWEPRNRVFHENTIVTAHRFTKKSGFFGRSRSSDTLAISLKCLSSVILWIEFNLLYFKIKKITAS